jgi:predicted RNA binding protein with dsRBD fold (UPF0201 family)
MSAEFRAKLLLEATVSPSEDPAKVASALGNVVGEPAVEVQPGSKSVRHETENRKALAHVRDQLRDRHVRSAARRQLLVRKEGRRSSLMLNRQAAAAGVVAICGSPEESPLGPVYMTVESGQLDGAIDWLTAYSEG